MNKTKRHEIFSRLRKDNPKPTTELHFNSTFELLIAVILSAQATDKSVNIATAKLYPIAHTPEAIYNLGEVGLKKFVKTIGLYNTKAKNIIKTCRILIDEHDSIVPDDQKKLEALPGVGRKTANVVRNTAFGHPLVDAHHWLILLGRYTCIARKPRCGSCLIEDLCEYKNKTEDSDA